MMKTIITANSKNPCLHCGKPDWCYTLPTGATVCNRGSIATGWIDSGKKDRNGSAILILEESAKKLDKVTVTSRQEWVYTDRQGQPLVKVARRNFSNGTKDIRQYHYQNGRWVSGRGSVQRKDIPIYRYMQIRDAIERGEIIFIVEGEKCADALVSLGIEATCNIGGSKQWSDSDVADFEGATNLVLVPDRDRPGLELMAKIHKSFPDALWLYVDPEGFTWHPDKISPSDGYDIADWIEDKKLNADQIWEAVEECRQELLPSVVPDFAPAPELHYTEKAVEALYSKGRYMALDGKLYKFSKTNYEPLGTQSELRKIAEWCRNTAVQTGVDKWKFTHANATTINNIWNWLMIRFGVDPDQINPTGLNLKNGTLKLFWEGKQVSWDIKNHSPDDYYTYCSEVSYDPKANSFNCKRLLECLDPDQQTIFLRTIAASLDLNKIRQYRGREVKALLLQGHGNNGKDSLREAVAILFSQSMINCTVSDFQAYDQGRKFPLAKLASKSISWASENSSFASLDNLQSLKAAITGEAIDIEEKNQPEYQINPATVFLFNCNDSPSLKGGLEAIASRWGILRFTKTYKRNADPNKRELEADPRFRYDPDFLVKNVAPSILNMLLSQLQPLIDEGIDYTVIEDSLKELQEESNHLWSFCREKGLNYSPNGKVYIKDLWNELREWYIQNGTLEIQTSENGKTKDIWHEQPNSRDKTVKGANQVHQRFTQLFPKVKKVMETVDQTHVGQAYLFGIAQTASCASCDAKSIHTASLTASLTGDFNEAVTIDKRSHEAHEAIFPLSLDHEDLIKVMYIRFFTFTPEMQQKVIAQLTEISSTAKNEHSSTSQPQNHNFQVDDRIVKKIDSSIIYMVTRLLEGNQIEIIQVGKSIFDVDWVDADDYSLAIDF